MSEDDHVTIACGCGEFAVESPDGTITIDVVCPECGNHFGQDATPDKRAESTADSDTFPHEVYARDADYVTLAFKRLTAERMADWLRHAAEVYDIGGASMSADHARHVAGRIESEVSDE